MLYCLEQSGEQDASIVFVNFRNPSGMPDNLNSAQNED
jgi:hypothetical protein